MSLVGTAFHRPFEEDMGLLIGTSFIMHYPDEEITPGKTRPPRMGEHVDDSRNPASQLHW
jgi:hypothetical protein